MNNRLLAGLLISGILLQGATLAMASHLVFLGTYTRNGSRGIYAVRLDSDSGALTTPALVAEASNPAWLALSPDRRFLYAIDESAAQATAYAIDARVPALKPLPRDESLATRRASPPSHLAVDATGRVLLAANYRDGYVAAMAIRHDGTLEAPSITTHTGRGPHATRQERPHPHSVTPSPDNRFVIVCDLGVDKVYSYALDVSSAKLAPANPPYVATEPGAGPRHFKFGLKGRYAYAINELANTITTYAYEAARGALTSIQSVGTLPKDFTGQNTTAEVRVHPNGRFAYGSNRGHDSIAVFAISPENGQLSLVEIVPSGGKTPRNFALSPDGNWLLCAHQDSDNLTTFRVDPATGRLNRTPHTATVPMCVCVLFHE